MTLIAAWPVKDGVVIHADSQETVGDYRIEVDKLKPVDIGQFRVIIAGAGPSKLVESLPIVLSRRIAAASSIADFENQTEEALAHFYAHDVKLYPGKKKEVKFFIGAWHQPSGEYGVWVTENVRLRRLPKDEALMFGCEEPIYWLTAKRLFSEGMSTAQAILAGLYLFTIAEGTSNYIKGPFSVAVVQSNGIHFAEESYVRQATEWLGEYERGLNELFLACADTSIPVHRLEDRITAFSQIALALHRQQIDRLVQSLSVGDLSKIDDPFPRFPVGVAIGVYGDGTLRVEHDEGRKQEAENRRFRRWMESHAIPVQCSECRTISDYPQASYFETLRSFQAFCKTCGKETEHRDIMPSASQKSEDSR
jgi:hypothetical protein